MCASSEDSRKSVRSLESAHPYQWTLLGNDEIYYGSMNGGIFDEISSFIAYAQSIY